MKKMKYTLCLLLVLSVLVSLCACGTSVVDPTEPSGTQAPTDPTQEQPQPTEPVSVADPVGIYRCTGVRTAEQTEYQEAPGGYGLEIYDDGEAMIFADDFVYDLRWSVEGNQFTGTTMDEPSLPMEGTVNGDVLEVVFDGISLRFEKKSEQELAEEAVEFARYLMVDTPQQFAVAYMGWMEPDEDLQNWLTQKCPLLADSEPYVRLIPKERVIGSGGEVYCIIPRDPASTVAVNLLQDTAGGEEAISEVLYRAESGDPFLLCCNYGGFYPDTQVIITDSQGAETIWYPQTSEFGFAVVPTNDDLQDLAYDFSYYSEVYPYGYNIWCGQGWEEPTQDYLSCICWTRYYEEIVDGGYIGYSWTMNLTNDGTGEIYFSDESGMEHYATYTGSWQLTDLEGYPGLSLNMTCADVSTEFEGKIPSSIEDAYVVLRAPDGDNLLIGIREGQDPCPMVVDGEDHYSLWWGAVG